MEIPRIKSAPDKPHIPFFTCRCATYNRPDVIGESVESFLKQDYIGQKELIIYNDTPGMYYEFDHPEVRVYNMPHRMFIGNKLNDVARLANGEFIVPWPDDDIFLSNTLSFYAEHTKNVRAFSPKGIIKWNGLSGRLMDTIMSGIVVVQKKLWIDTGGWEEDHQLSDTFYFNRIKKHVKVADVPLDEIFMLWRRGPWNVDRPLQKQGIVKIEPVWKKDYRQIVKTHARALKRTVIKV